MPMPRPLLFLDVDGPLIPFGAGPYPTYPPMPPAGATPLLARLAPGLGPRLAALPYALVWATTWGADANAVVARRLGLPDLPVLPESEDEEEGPPAAAGARRAPHWKTPGIVAWAAGRPFAWVDDEIGAVDRAWVTAHHPGPALLLRVDPGRGLTGADLERLAAWRPAGCTSGAGG